MGHFGLELIPSHFYSRCTLCNGEFETVSLEELERQTLLGGEERDVVPRKVMEGGVDDEGRPLTFFRCMDCAQVYWWGSKSHGTAKKFRTMFDRLIRGNEARSASSTQKEEEEGGEEAKVGESDGKTSSEESIAVTAAYDAYLSTLSVRRLAVLLTSLRPHPSAASTQRLRGVSSASVAAVIPAVSVGSHSPGVLLYQLH